jgi:hypothetical protein
MSRQQRTEKIVGPRGNDAKPAGARWVVPVRAERGLRVLAEFCTYGETDGHSIWPFGVAVDKHDTVYGRAIPTATSTSPTGAITAFAFLTRKAPR